MVIARDYRHSVVTVAQKTAVSQPFGRMLRPISLHSRHMAPAYLGEFEQLLLLAVLRLGSEAYALEIARELDVRAGRSVSRGALYTSLDRLEDKGLLRWKSAAGTPARNGLPRRLYTVTAAGLTALRASRSTLRRMWRGLEDLLEEPIS